MTRARKVDLIALETLLHAGHSMSEVARRMGVNKGSISRAAARLRAASKEVAISNTERVNSTGVNEERLRKILATLERQLEEIGKAIDGSSSAEEKRKWMHAQVQLSRELRQAVGVLQTTITAIYTVREQEKFRELVLETIAGVDKDVRDQIIRALKQRRSGADTAAGSQAAI